MRNNLTKYFITVFCDTGWEHPLTYKYIEEIRDRLGLNLVTLKSKKFDGMVDLARKKTRWAVFTKTVLHIGTENNPHD